MNKMRVVPLPYPLTFLWNDVKSAQNQTGESIRGSTHRIRDLPKDASGRHSCISRSSSSRFNRTG
ncbi:hypothetical protein MESS4_p40035 [Mesorhizobium sp. STM 4661]|nr:hypothetical protein MESS4_p40035 [Mesorhizobium sp. STM 4661]